MTGPGQYKCSCPKGHNGDASKSCKPIDPCTPRPGVAGPCDPNAVCLMTKPGDHTCTCRRGFQGDGKFCKQIDVVVKWVTGANGQKTPIVSNPPSASAATLSGQPIVGPVAIDAAGHVIPAGAAGANPLTGVAPSATPIGDLKSAVGEVLKVITSKLDDSDLRTSFKKQKQQDAAVVAVNKRLARLERNTAELIANTNKQTETLKTMMGFDAVPAPAPQPAAAAAPAPAAPAQAPAKSSATTDIAALKQRAVEQAPKA